MAIAWQKLKKSLKLEMMVDLIWAGKLLRSRVKVVKFFERGLGKMFKNEQIKVCILQDSNGWEKVGLGELRWR